MDCIHMIGYDAVHPSDFVYDTPEAHGHYLLILTHTQLRFRDGCEERIYPARHAALFSPNSRCKTARFPCRTRITVTTCSSCSPGSTCRAATKPSPPS